MLTHNTNNIYIYIFTNPDLQNHFALLISQIYKSRWRWRRGELLLTYTHPNAGGTRTCPQSLIIKLAFVDHLINPLFVHSRFKIQCLRAYQSTHFQEQSGLNRVQPFCQLCLQLISL